MKLISLLLIFLGVIPHLHASEPISADELASILGVRYWRVSLEDPDHGGTISFKMVHHVKNPITDQWQVHQEAGGSFGIPVNPRNPESTSISDIAGLAAVKEGT